MTITVRLGIVWALTAGLALAGSATRAGEGGTQGARSDDRRPAPKDVLTWLRRNAIPLDSVEAGHGFADLERLAPIVGQARVVGLGEATHGTREFFQLKHRLLEFLVERMGFTLFAIEAGFPECLAVNDYVLNGHGDAKRALRGLGWIWQTDEALSMVEWIRRYNADPRHEHKVELYGIDMTLAPLAVAYVSDYLKRVDPPARTTVATALAPLATLEAQQSYSTRTADERARTAQAIVDLIARFDAKKNEYVLRSSEGEWVLARHNAVVLSQAEHHVARGYDGPWRDRAMAENVGWLLSNAPKDARLVLWAHDSHVTFHSAEGRETLGQHLRKSLGRDYLAFGFAFNAGSFRALDAAALGRGPRTFTLPVLPAASLGTTLAALRVPRFVVDVRSAPSGAVADWAARLLPAWEVGSVFSDTAMRTAARVAPGSFDAVVFVDRTTPAQSLDVVPPKSLDAASVPTNLDFEAGRVGETPMGWHVPGVPREWGYRAELSSDRPPQGKLAAVLRAPAGGVTTNAWGCLMQCASAVPFRDKRIRYRAAVRVESANPGDHAALWLRIDRPEDTAFFDRMEKRPIIAPTWARYEIAGDVPTDADELCYGIMLHGGDRAFIDDAALQVIPRQ